MSEAKFTKGEWSIHGDWGIKAEGVNDCIATFEHFDQRPEWAFANAHLIAAAPEMYEMLDEVLNVLGHELNPTNKSYIKAIKELLAKARGEK